MNVNQKTLELFNAVVANPSHQPLFIEEYGVIIDKTATRSQGDISKFLMDKALNGEQLNKTFHKSWKKVQESSRFRLYLEQMLHYLTTYGTGHTSSFVYTPDEKLDIPKIEVTWKVIRGLSKEELIDKCLKLLSSGVALKPETLDLIFGVLDDLGYVFSGEEDIKNKEAIVRIADVYGVYPKNPAEFIRFIIFKAIGNTLVVKDKETILGIKESSFNPAMHFNKYGLKKLATVFNRYKPLFLAFKGKCPSVINKISKLSKEYHKPIKEDVLNLVTSKVISDEILIKRLESATFFQIARALQALYTRKKGQRFFTYKIRNGKSWTKQNEVNKLAVHSNFLTIREFLMRKYNFKGKKFFIPPYIEYSIPTSEKMFVGNIPTGTTIKSKDLAVGIYWENSWGARDLDLSALSMDKVGWNSTYNTGGITYSGDLTDATNGAVEYLKVENIEDTYLVLNNVFSGNEKSGYKVIVGKGDDVSRGYMMNPNNLIFETKTETVQKNSIVGMLLPNPTRFIVLNLGAGGRNVSGRSDLSDMQRESFKNQYSGMYSLNRLLELCGGEVINTVHEDAVDLSPESLEKDTLLNLFS